MHAVRLFPAAAGSRKQLTSLQECSPCIELQDVLVVQRMHGPDLSVQDRHNVSSLARWCVAACSCCNRNLLYLYPNFAHC